MKPPIPNSLRYGLIWIAVMIAGLALMEITGQNQTFEHSPIAALSTFAAPPIVLFFGLRSARTRREGRLTYGQGLAEGARISAVYGFLSPLVTLGYYTLVNPALVASAREAYGLNGAVDATVIAVDMLIQLASALVLGTTCSAVLSLFLKEKRR